MSFTIPSEILPNSKEDLTLTQEDNSKSFNELVSENNPIFMGMLAYVFHRTTSAKKRPANMKQAKKVIPKLLQYDSGEFDKISNKYGGLYDIDVKSFNNYIKHYLEVIESTDMYTILETLSKTDFFPTRMKSEKVLYWINQETREKVYKIPRESYTYTQEDENEGKKLSTGVEEYDGPIEGQKTSYNQSIGNGKLDATDSGEKKITPFEDRPLELNEDELKEFTLSQIDDRSAIDNLLFINERGSSEGSSSEGSSSEGEPQQSGELIDAFDKSKPILFEDITDYFNYESTRIDFDIKTYIEDLFKKEGFGDINAKDEDGNYISPFKVGQTRSETKTESGTDFKGKKFEGKVKVFSEKDEQDNIPLLYVILQGDERVGYSTEDVQFKIEGFTGSKIYNSLEEVYDAMTELQTNPKVLEKYIEKIILSQDKHPLKDMIYSYLIPEKRKLKLGELKIFVSNTESGSEKKKTSWVESTKTKLNLDKDVEITLTKEEKEVLKEMLIMMGHMDKMDIETLEDKINNIQISDNLREQIKELSRSVYEDGEDKPEEVEDKPEEVEDKPEEDISWTKILSSYEVIKGKLDIELEDLFAKYQELKRGIDTSNDDNTMVAFDFVTLKPYVNDLMRKTGKTIVFGESRVPIIFADTVYSSESIIDTTPQNYKLTFSGKTLTGGRKETVNNRTVDGSYNLAIKHFLNIKQGYNRLKALVN